MNENLKFFLSVVIMFLRSTLKSAKAVKALLAIAPWLIEARDLLDQVIATIPASVVAKHRKAIKAGHTYALKISET